MKQLILFFLDLRISFVVKVGRNDACNNILEYIRRLEKAPRIYERFTLI